MIETGIKNVLNPKPETRNKKRKAVCCIPYAVCVFILLILLGFSADLTAQQYFIQPGDRLAITFWQEPTLNTEVTVRRDGSIELPVIGRINAANRTTTLLSQDIVERISRYRIKVTQASVQVLEFSGNKVYVTGQVGAPGKYSFEEMPSLWEILQEAGGLLETANTRKVAIIRSGAENSVTEVDLTDYFESGNLDGMPSLRGGDTVHVPALSTSTTAGDAAPSLFTGESEIYIMGEVGAPGKYSLEEGTDLLEALVMAGGTTPRAKIKDIRVSKRAVNPGVIKVNLDEYLKSSDPMPITLQPGDAIYVPTKPGETSVFTRFVFPMVTATATALIVAVIVRR